MADVNIRVVNTAIWRDDWFLSLTESEQHLFLYLLTCPAANLSGIYQLGLQEAAFHTKIDSKEIVRIFTQRFQPDSKAYFEIGYVVMKNWLKHNHYNPNMWKAVVNSVNRTPDWLRKDLLNSDSKLYIPFRTLSNDTLMVRNGLLTVSNGKRNRSEENNSSLRSELKGKADGSRPLRGAPTAEEGDEDEIARAKREAMEREAEE